MKKYIRLLLLIVVLPFMFVGCKHFTPDNKPSNSPTETLDLDQNIISVSVTINESVFIIKLNDNDTSKAFVKGLPMTLNMSAMPHEKYFYLLNNLPSNPQPVGKIQVGDIMLWGSNCLVLFYESFTTSYSYTKIGYIEDTFGLDEAVGKNNITMIFEVTR